MGTFDTLSVDRVKASRVDVAIDIMTSGNTVLVANTAALGARGGLSMVIQLLLCDASSHGLPMMRREGRHFDRLNCDRRAFLDEK